MFPIIRCQCQQEQYEKEEAKRKHQEFLVRTLLKKEVVATWEKIPMVQVTMLALSAIIFVIVYGRMVEIYLMVSLAPIPFATFGNHEQSHTGQNYLRSLFALGFQGFLIRCV